MALLISSSLLIGRMLGGPASPQGLTTALVTAMRNPGLALLFASRHGTAMPDLKPGILIYVLLTVLLSLPLVQQRKRLAAG